MTNRSTFAFVLLITACGGGSDTPDAPIVPDMITISGTASERTAGGSMPVDAVTVGAYQNDNETTAVATATTDATGAYSIVITTNGRALDGYLKATKAGLLDTYLYPSAVVVADFTGASVNMLTANTFGLLSDVLCQANQDLAMGAIAVQVNDAAGVTVGGATIASTPTSPTYCYNGTNGLPDAGATETQPDGIGYMFNVTGDVAVRAMKSGTTFREHSVKARGGAFTTTLVEP